jgi:transposase
MAFREVSVVQIKEALRRWLKGEGERPIASGIGIDRKTARRYIAAAVELGVDRSGGEDQLTDELIGQVVERVRPHRTDGHGEAWRTLLAEEAQIKAWVKQDLTVVKIGILLARRGVVVPHRTLARFATQRCGAGRRTVTVRVDDPPPGIELQVDFGRLGLVPEGDKKRVCQGLVFTACYSRHLFVWPTFSQTTDEVIRGFEAAWGYFGGVFPVVIPDNMKSIIIEAENTAPRINDVFLEYAQARGFSIDAARVATPTDKPRVERVVHYTQHNFFAGEAFVDLADGGHAHPRDDPVPADRDVPHRGASPPPSSSRHTVRHAEVVRAQGPPGLPRGGWAIHLLRPPLVGRAEPQGQARLGHGEALSARGAGEGPSPHTARPEAY